MFYLKKEDVSDFQDRFAVYIFLKYYSEITLIEYVSKNHFVGVDPLREGETHFYLFNKPDGEAPKGVVYISRKRHYQNGFEYRAFSDDFIQEYRIFADNPFKYIKEHFIESEWENKYSRLFISKPPVEENIGKLYKYKSNPNEEDDKACNIFNDFIGGRLTFVNPSTCNDPFDCECEIPLHDAVPVIIYKAMQKTRYSKNPAKVIPFTKITGATEEFFKEYGDKFEGKKEEFEELLESVDPIYSKQNKSEFYDVVVNNCVNMAAQVLNLKEDFRILCLARNPKDILMWGYYGNGGKGCCCGHMPDKIQKGIQKRGSKFCIYGEINYPDTNNRPEFHVNYNDIADDIWGFIIECTFTKYRNWKHEKEFRYLILGEDFIEDYITIDSTIDETYLGCKSDDVTFYSLNKDSFSTLPHILRMHPKKYELI